MKTLAGLLLATLLTMSAGCAQKDWIDRTLVTVDVTRAWTGGPGGSGTGARNLQLELEQQGPTVKGFIRLLEATGGGAASGPLDGTVAGDVFHFSGARGQWEGELNGQWRRDERSDVEGGRGRVPRG